MCVCVDQAIWIEKVLMEKNTDFGLTRRKVSIFFDAVVVSIIERLNGCGVFLSI